MMGQWLALLLSVAAMGCAATDGRGFGSLEGQIGVELLRDRFSTGGKEAIATEVVVRLRGIEIEGDRVRKDGGIEHVVAGVVVGAEFTPLTGYVQSRFGPAELDHAAYAKLSAVVHSIDVSGSLDGKHFHVAAAPPEGIRVASPADLPVDRDHLPLITVTGKLKLPTTLLEGVDLDPAADVAKVAAALIVNLKAGASFEATWVREDD